MTRTWQRDGTRWTYGAGIALEQGEDGKWRLSHNGVLALPFDDVHDAMDAAVDAARAVDEPPAMTDAEAWAKGERVVAMDSIHPTISVSISNAPATPPVDDELWVTTKIEIGD